jgi:hypothetical protein
MNEGMLVWAGGAENVTKSANRTFIIRAISAAESGPDEYRDIVGPFGKPSRPIVMAQVPMESAWVMLLDEGIIFLKGL